MPQEADATSGFLTWLTEAATWLLGSDGVLLALLGLLIILGFRRDRRIASFKELVAAEALLESRGSGPDSSITDHLVIRPIPDRPWGWFKRRWSEIRAFPRCRLQHYRMVLLIENPDRTFTVVLLWEPARSLREVANRVLATYGHEAVSPDVPLEDNGKYTVVPLENNSYLIIEPTGWRRRRRQARQQRAVVQATDRSSKLRP